MSTSAQSASSWVEIPSDSDFSLDNIPFGVAKSKRNDWNTFCATAIGETVINLQLLQEAGLFDQVSGLHPTTFYQTTLNVFIEHPSSVWKAVRSTLVELLSETDSSALYQNKALQQAAFYARHEIQMLMPIEVKEYTDFYSSREHATNVGTMFRGKDNALQPNWLHLPVGYHGRSSTVVISGTPIHRPCGQLQKDPSDPKQGSIYGPCKLMDFELEVASIVGGPSNALGHALTMEEAKDRIFGFVLLNDWSARDIQKWEYVPLGPFTAKNFASTISPWIVTAQALDAHFVGTTSAGPQQTEPTPLEYLQDPNYSSYDITLQVQLQGEEMDQPYTICKSNFLNLYWNAAQQLVHHSVTGCVMNAGDLLGSGTISGQSDDSFGSMLELSWKGSREVNVGIETRKFLKDGDTVVMTGWCSPREGRCGRVGFGECSGKLLPAKASSSSEASPVIKSIEPFRSRFQKFKLYSYWRSSSTWRVRIALHAKGIPFETIPVDLKKGHHKTPEFLAKNPMGLIPVLEYTDSHTNKVHCKTQSVAIIEFLDAVVAPNAKPLIPRNALERATALEMVELINSSIGPLQNAPMVRGLESASDGKINAQDFAASHISQGLTALNAMVEEYRNEETTTSGPYCLGTFAPTIVDLFLIPQLFNARRYNVDLTKFTALLRVEAACANHPWFLPAHANVQPDAEV